MSFTTRVRAASSRSHLGFDHGARATSASRLMSCFLPLSVLAIVLPQISSPHADPYASFRCKPASVFSGSFVGSLNRTHAPLSLAPAQVKDVDDAAELDATCAAMALLGISDDHRFQILTVIAGILHLGNIQVTPKHRRTEDAGVADGDTHAPVAARLLGLDAAMLNKWLVNRTIQTGKEVRSPLRNLFPVLLRAPNVSVSGECLDTNFCPTGPVISCFLAPNLKTPVRFRVRTLSKHTYVGRSHRSIENPILKQLQF